MGTNIAEKKRGRFTACEAKFLELAVRILCDDTPPKMPDLTYLYGETIDNETSVLSRGAMIYHNGFTPLLGVCDGNTISGYPGFCRWNDILTNYFGIKKETIMPIRVPYEINVNTLTETEALVSLAKHFDWKHILIVAPPFHQIRCFATTASVALKNYPELKVYNMPGTSQGWNKKARHSQGTLTGKRFEFIHTELKRLNKYYKKGDLLSCQEILEYLRNRDS